MNSGADERLLLNSNIALKPNSTDPGENCPNAKEKGAKKFEVTDVDPNILNIIKNWCLSTGVGRRP